MEDRGWWGTLPERFPHDPPSSILHPRFVSVPRPLESTPADVPVPAPVQPPAALAGAVSAAVPAAAVAGDAAGAPAGDAAVRGAGGGRLPDAGAECQAG